MIGPRTICFLFTVTIFCWDRATGESEHLRVPRDSSDDKGVIVELLIVCDKEFGDLFQQNRQKIVDFWALQLWDVDMKFKSLRRKDISFKVNQLITIKTTEQWFIEDVRASNGDLYLFKALEKFNTWIKGRQDLVKFDIALLATGSKKVEKDSSSSAWEWKSACKSGKNTFIIHFDSPWENGCTALADTLAHIMGAPGNSDEASDCKDKGFIRNGVCGKNQYFFSKCSDLAISNYIRSTDGACLRTVALPSIDVISNSSGVTYPPSLDEQCSYLTANRHAVVAKEKSRCLMAKCNIPKNGSLSFYRTFYPIDNSPCDVNKFCFRGRCLPRGYRLMNLESGNCMHSGDRFLSNDFPIMVNCNTSVTPLDQLMVLDSDLDGLLLATPYSTPDASENEDKCLTLDIKEENLQYTKCSNEDNDRKWLLWEFVKIYKGKEEFMIRHAFANVCATVDPDGNVKANKTCNDEDKWQLWKFWEEFEVPKKWLKTNDRLSESTDSVAIEDTSTLTQNYEVSQLPGDLHFSSQGNDFDDGTSTPLPKTAESQPYNIVLLQVWLIGTSLLLLGVVVGMWLYYSIYRLGRRGNFNSSENSISVVYSK